MSYEPPKVRVPRVQQGSRSQVLVVLNVHVSLQVTPISSSPFKVALYDTEQELLGDFPQSEEERRRAGAPGDKPGDKGGVQPGDKGAE